MTLKEEGGTESEDKNQQRAANGSWSTSTPVTGVQIYTQVFARYVWVKIPLSKTWDMKRSRWVLSIKNSIIILTFSI